MCPQNVPKISDYLLQMSKPALYSTRNSKGNHMAISIENEILKEIGFQNESELQGYLERCPYLLISESEPNVHSVQREVRLPSAGILDLLLVDETGCPIAVEVKLSSNGQSRREVVAQVFDYVSDLSQLTVDELDDLVDGSLEQTLFSINDNNTLWKSCGVNLRAGIIKVIDNPAQSARHRLALARRPARAGSLAAAAPKDRAG